VSAPGHKVLKGLPWLLFCVGNDLFEIPDDGGSDDGMYTVLNEKSELERFRNSHSSDELKDMVERYRDVWEPFFERNMGREVPRHPWKVLKRARKTYAEEENDGDWPGMAMRHSLRVVKDEYTTVWRELAFDE